MNEGNGFIPSIAAGVRLMKRDLSAIIHAADVLLGLPVDEHRPALAKMADCMRACVGRRETPPEQLRAAKSRLDELERRLHP